MPNIIFPTSSSPGVRPQESGGRLINAFAERAPKGAPSDIIIKRSPGLRFIGETADAAHIHTRGFLDCGSVALWIVNGRVYSINSSLAIGNLGALTGSLPVTTARNNNVTPDNVVVTDTGVFNLFVASAPTAFADGDLPSTPTSVCDFEGYFIWSYANGTIYASNLNSVSVNALSFTTEQGLNVRRVVRYAGRLYAFGDKWTGVYRNAGTSPFPLAREATIPKGIIGTHAVAGWETGWANELLWVGDDFRIYRMRGYIPEPVPTTPSAVSRDIQSAIIDGNRDLIEAFVYVHENNPFWVLTCHDSWTWEYNLGTGEWNERLSYNQSNWRGMKSIRIFDKWLIGDQLTGSLYHIDGDYFREFADHLIWHVESGTMTGFPNKSSIPRSSFHVTTGVGSPSLVSDPKIEISWSLDGGHSWGNPVIRKLGASGETKFHPYVLNCGLSRGQGIRYRLRVSDPVWVGLNGGIVDAQNRGVTG